MASRSSRKAQLSAEAQNDWAEYKLDAERKAGKVLVVMQEAGELRIKGVVPREGGPLSLGDLGISSQTASKWRAITSLPEATYEAYKVSARAEGEITEAGALRIAKAVKAQSQPPKPPLDIGEFTEKLSRAAVRQAQAPA
jgi:hypothetical protein